MIDNLTVDEHLANSDHNILRFNVNVCTIMRDTCQDRLNFFKGNYDGMQNFLAKTDWDREFANNDADGMWNKFSSLMQQAITQFVPVCKKRKRKYPLWMDRSAIKARRKKSKYFSKFSRSKSDHDKVLYNRASNRATSTYRKSKAKY